ncbi:MAG: hypothetical protein DMG05_28635 [Acidobacteria bacterium]|nr:MAG: hypothetical protein DMG05_28635 [Acidobacteriota bacterium]
MKEVIPPYYIRTNPRLPFDNGRFPEFIPKAQGKSVRNSTLTIRVQAFLWVMAKRVMINSEVMVLNLTFYSY